MRNLDAGKAFTSLTTPQLFDACLSTGVEIRCAPPGGKPLAPHMKTAGRVLPARHAGSVDVFLEAFEAADEGDVLVIDNQGREDEGCMGDLVALEARAARLAGIFVWGAHRDTRELVSIGLPIFSYGACLMGPRRLDSREPDALERAAVGKLTVGREDTVFWDIDGAIFIPTRELDRILSAAESIAATERRQSHALESGSSLRDQLRFQEYLARRARDASYSFRRHLDGIGGAIEK